MAEEEVKSFENVDKHLVELKGLVMKIGFVSTSLITLELLSEKLKMWESTIHKELIPLLKLINLMPTDAPPVHKGEKRVVLAVVRKLVQEGVVRGKMMMMERLLEKCYQLQFHRHYQNILL